MIRPAAKGYDCTVIILSYNTKDLTDTCLTKLEASAKHCESKLKNRIHISVVDNNSSDGSVKMIRDKHKAVHLTALNENTGYAKGNNLAMKEADTAYILLMNSDLFVYEDTLYTSLQYMGKHAECSVLCPRQLLREDAPFEPYGGHLPTPLRTLRWLTGMENMPVIRNMIQRIYRYDDDFYKKTAVMEWNQTSCFLLRREVFEQTGGFDEHLFLFMEDVEWCKRIDDAGYKIYNYPEATVIHYASSSTGKLKNREVTRLQVEGAQYYQKKHHPMTAWIINPLISLALGFRNILS